MNTRLIVSSFLVIALSGCKDRAESTALASAEVSQSGHIDFRLFSSKVNEEISEEITCKAGVDQTTGKNFLKIEGSQSSIFLVPFNRQLNRQILVNSTKFETTHSYFEAILKDKSEVIMWYDSDPKKYSPCSFNIVGNGSHYSGVFYCANLIIGHRSHKVLAEGIGSGGIFTCGWSDKNVDERILE